MPYLIQETPPQGTPPGYTAYRFVDDTIILRGVILKSIKVEDGHPVYDIAAGQKYTIKRQSSSDPEESHVLIEPGGYVEPALIQRA